MIDIVVQVVTEVAKCLAAPIGRQFSYLRNYTNNLQGLKDEVQKLTDARECVHHRVDDANRKGEEIEQGVQRWLTSVDETIKEAEKIVEDEGKSLCLKGLCPNLKNRYQLSKDAVRKLNDIKRHREEGKFEGVSYRTPPHEIWLPATKGYESFESRMKTMGDIQNALSDPNVSMIGVYGMGGIGKTTLVKEIASQAEKDKLFDEVVFAQVSHNPDVRKIQGEIADKIGLEFHEETESGRARKLRERLSGGKKNPSSKEATHPYLDTSSFKVETEAGRNTKQESSIGKKVLVILDDIWKDLDLETTGIPLGQNNKGCKVLLTTRNLDVLTDKMNCHHNIQVGSLHEEEAWSLFKKMAGDGIENPDLQHIAIDIAKECSGLPIAIVTVARALRNKRLHHWKSALQDLRNPSERSLTTGVQAAAYSCIELSYKYLDDDEHRSTFLLCRLMGPNGFYFSDLLKYSIGLGLIQGVKTMEGARDKLYTLLDKLKASCLLLDGQTSEWFSMHDVVRDVALSIATRDQHIFTVGGETVSIRWPNKDIPEGCTSITLYHCNIGELVDGLECPRLELLHISNNNSFLKIHENFFTGMTKLKVLDLTRIQLMSLPSSICLLGNLRTLCLDLSELGDIAIIGELKKLEILSFISSNIEQLPKEIGHLSCLKLLDLSNCYKLKFIPANVISSLSQLEELYMGNTFIRWDNEGSNTERTNASLHELKHLTHLTNLEIHIKDARILPRGLFSEKLERYKIYIGDEWVWSRKYEGTRTLKLKVNTNMCMEDKVTLQLKKIEVLYLDELQGTDSVLCKADKEGFPQLKHLHVQNNRYFRFVLDSMEWLPHKAFPQLESLFLSNLIKMEKICNGQLTAESFFKLNILKVDKCDNLKNVFSLSMVESLPQLETMEVAECKSMEEIFAVGRKDEVNNNEVTGKIELGQIRFLTLKSLPKLNSFCSKMKAPSMSAREVPKDIEIVLEDKHDTPTTLFHEMVLLPKLEALEVSAINCENIWQNQPSAISSCFQNLTRLIVQGCGNLKYMFSSSIVGSFLKLQHLEVCKCPVLEEILVMDSSREEERKSIIFPQLNFLKLEDLENLRRFSLEYGVEFISLKQLEIKQCPKFKTIVLKNVSTDFTTGEEVGQMSLLELHAFFNEKVAFPELEEMVISNLDNLKTVWDNKLAHQSFRKLKLIKIEDCNELVTLFPSNMFKRFAGLEFLTINNCASLEEIFEIQELNFEETHSPFLIQLKQVSVSGCRSLKNIFQASIAKSLLQLEKLDVRNCGVLTEIVAKERGEKASAIVFVFPKVSSLVLAFLPKLTTFYPGAHISEWQVLEKLIVADCENVKTFASEIIDFREANDEVQLPAQQTFFLVEKVMPRLKILQLDINDIIMICHGQFARDHFRTVKALVVRRSEAAVFSLGLLERFYKLERLTLGYGSRKELFSYKDMEKQVENFQQIIGLRLENLSQMKHIWRQDSKLNSILQNLEILELNHCDSLINLVPSSATFRNLTTLEVCYCKGMVNLITSSTAKSMQQLERMTIEGCKGMTDIVANEGDAEGDEIIFNKLKVLLLDGLENLTSFCSMNYTFGFPSLEVLIVRDCPQMKIFCQGALSTSKLNMVCQNWEDLRLQRGRWDGDLNATMQQLHRRLVESHNLENMEVSGIDFEEIWQNQYPKVTSRFQNLKCLFVQGNGNLTYLFSSSIVRSFLQLQHLEICKCPNLQEIIAVEELREEERKDIVFPQLNFLKIEDLENLRRFCFESFVEFPSLEKVEIKQCPEFKAFVLKNLSTEKMKSMEIQPFFNDKVSFPVLEEMGISMLDNLKMIWDNKLAHCSFSKLTLIKVEGCKNLVTLSSSNMFKRFSRLQYLTINNCASVEEIFGLQELDFEKTHSPFIIHLKQMSVSNCGSLKNIFQASIAKSLLQLEKLEVKNCKVLAAIVAMEQAAGTSTVRFVYPKVSHLVLAFLPKLTTFYPGVHILEWQMLEHLVVVDCENVKTFALDMLDFSNGNTKDEGQLMRPVQQAFVLGEKVIPRLKFLQLNIQDVMTICHGQFARHHFSKLDTLIIRKDEAAAFSPGLLERYPNLKTLFLCYSSYKEIFSYEDVEKHAENVERITSLDLQSLSQLKHMWRQDSKLNSILQNLERLHVEYCDSLINLVPSSATFRNLTTLEVYYCNGMVNLITSSTAKGLECLKQISVEGCKGMTDIVANEGNAGEDEIVLNKLEELSLIDLESLQSFCSTNYRFRLPSLDVLIVRDCPKMKIFCEGTVNTSKLAMVCQNREDWRLDKGYWEGDLNTTIQQMHHNMVELHNTENMEVSATDFEKIWQNQYPDMTSRFQNLKHLIVQGSGNLTYLFSSSITRSFLQLQHLEICKCPTLYEIIAMEELGEEERKDSVFPQLNYLKIEDLENLKRFCSESYVEFPSLKKLKIKQCPKFKAFFLKNLSTVLTGGEVGKMGSKETQPFFSDKLAFPNLGEMMISQLDDLEMIWHENLDHHSFGRLKLMKIEGCNKLLTLFPSNMFRRFSRLESLIINHCDSLEEIFEPQGLDFETGYSKPVNKLELVSVSHCKSLKNIFQASIAKTLMQLERLEVLACGALTEIVARELGAEASTVRFVFPKVVSLNLLNLPELTSFYPREHISEWPALKELRISFSQKVKVFASESLDSQITGDKGQLDIPTQRSFFLLEKISPGLEFLVISSKDIMMTCHSQFTGHHLSKLRTLFIVEDEAAVFRLGTLERFYNLTSLVLHRSSYKELFSNEEVEQHSGNLARIKSLWLQYLSDLKHMWKQDSECNSVLKNLNVLHVDHCDSLKNLVPSAASFQNLTTLEVYYCMRMINLVSSSTARTLERLKRMSIEGCQRLIEIIPNEEHVSEDEIVFSKLEELSLIGLESLESFCSVNYSFNFPSLDVLIVRDCPKMKIFCEGELSTSKLQMVCQNREEWRFDKGCWEGDLNATMQRLHHNTVELRNLENMELSATDFEKIWQNQYPEMTSRFQNLKRLLVQGSGNLTYLFSSSIARSFLQLQHLEICKCPTLHEIIAVEELREEERKDIVFPQLNFLKIEDLENLRRFSLENDVGFPSLKRLEIKQCPKFKAFFLKNLSTALMKGEVGKMGSKETQPFFPDKVAFPDLEEMMISQLDDLEMIWHQKLDHHSFGRLKLMKIEGCNKLLTLFPSNMLGRFSRLESLTINDCSSLEEIFGPQGLYFETGYSIPVNKLKLVSVSNCNSLKNIFQASIAKALLQLEDLDVSKCGALTEIVAREGGVEASTVRLVFPKVICLKLLDLPELSTFYAGEHISEWPVLKELWMFGCQQVKVFASESLDFQITGDKGQLDIPTQRSLFLLEKISPSLELLQISSKDIMMTRHSQFTGHLCSKLKTLLIGEDEASVFRLSMLERFHNLTSLTLHHSSYKELFSNEEVKQHSGNLARTKTLWLQYLSDLKHMWKHDSEFNSILKNLEVLHVDHCDSLKNLVPSSASFQNLTTLEVCYCMRMINLVSSSTARTLERLKRMSIEGCRMLTEIIQNEEHVAEDEIVFSKLEELSLIGLESLESFCSVNYSFNFPSLDVLIVRDCPKMKIFCEGALSTSKLQMVCQNREEWRFDKGCWEGDLNATMQRLHQNVVEIAQLTEHGSLCH